MALITFAEVRTAFQHDATVQAFECMFCDSSLENWRKTLAQGMLHTDPRQLGLKGLRDIINLLICATHQTGSPGYTNKDMVEAIWCLEFPHLNFDTHRHRSRYSLVNARHRIVNERPFSAPMTPPSSGQRTHPAVDVVSEQTLAPPARPNFLPDASATSSDGPPTPRTPIISEDDGNVFGSPESPLGTRALRNAHSQVQAEATPQMEHETNIVSSTPRLQTPPPDQDGEMQDTSPEGAPEGSDDRGQAPTTGGGRFSPGDASTWSPWTIRSEVLTLLLEPLPKPKAKGTIYAVNVEADGSPPMVKIGFTTRAIRTRLREIANQHGHTLNLRTTYSISGIPLLQLQRLEALVHADLAYFQRDLRVQRGRTHRTHHEYFEVNLATAQSTIQRWWAVMRDIGLEPGAELDQTVVDAIQGSTALNIERSDTEATAMEPDGWARINSDHGRRESVWDTVFRRDSGGFGKGGGTSGVIWILLALLLPVAPDLLKSPPGLVCTSMALLIALLKNWRLL